MSNEVEDQEVEEVVEESGDSARDEVKTVVELAGLYHNHDVHLPNRTIWMSGTVFEDGSESGVDVDMANTVIKNIDILTHLAPDEGITIIMNNIGGDEYHGAAIIDAILTCPCQVTIKVRGHAMSMGSLILQAADRRIMGPNSRQMIHYGTWGAYNHAKTAQQHAKEGLWWDEWMERWYLARIHERQPDFPLDELKKLLDHDTYLSPEQSIALGLADEIG